MNNKIYKNNKISLNTTDENQEITDFLVGK